MSMTPLNSTPSCICVQVNPERHAEKHTFNQQSSQRKVNRGKVQLVSVKELLDIACGREAGYKGQLPLHYGFPLYTVEKLEQIYHSAV